MSRKGLKPLLHQLISKHEQPTFLSHARPPCCTGLLDPKRQNRPQRLQLLQNPRTRNGELPEAGLHTEPPEGIDDVCQLLLIAWRGAEAPGLLQGTLLGFFPSSLYTLMLGSGFRVEGILLYPNVRFG